MKTTRIILIVIAWLWIAIICLLSIENFTDFTKDPVGDISILIGILLAMVVFAFPSFILLFFAKKIKRKIEKKEKEKLINSFENV
jgi:hypothetical protein